MKTTFKIKVEGKVGTRKLTFLVELIKCMSSDMYSFETTNNPYELKVIRHEPS